MWYISGENKLVIWCLFYGIRNIPHSTECNADGINFILCGSLDDFGSPQWLAQDCWRIPQQLCGIISKSELCSAEGVNSESNGENWVKYAIIRYKTNNKIALSENIHNKV